MATIRDQRRRQTKERILAAARGLFAELGYERATIRAVAAAASVDPALVMQHFGSKEELFKQAVHTDSDEPLDLDVQRLTELLLEAIRFKLHDVDDGSLALLRSMLTHPEAADQFRDATIRQLRQFAAAIDTPDADLRAALLVSTTLGLTITTHLLALPALRDATPEQIVDLLRPCLQSLTGSAD